MEAAASVVVDIDDLADSLDGDDDVSEEDADENVQSPEAQQMELMVQKNLVASQLQSR